MKTNPQPTICNLQRIKGISIIEILIVITICTIALVSLLGVAAFSLRISTLTKETNQASDLAIEAIEAIRNFRDGTDWNTNGLGTLATGISYYPKKSTDNPPKWQLVQGEEQTSNFNRKVVFNNVQRDTNDNIVETGGTNDPNTKKAIVTISWNDKKVEIFTYFTNWKQ